MTDKALTDGNGTVLDALDNAKLSWFHFKAIVIAGMGFFTDAYDLQNIGMLTKLIGYIYYQGSMPLDITIAITTTALCGTLAGQLFFGWAGDVFGRKSVYGLTLAIMVVASIGSGLSFGRSPMAVVATLCFWRFVLGFGIGGDYPLSAVIMSEYSNKASRGAFIASVFAMQGTGYLVANCVVLLISYFVKTYSDESAESADYVWRAVLMFGFIPTILTAYARNKLPETARFTLNVAHDAELVEEDMKGVIGETTGNSAVKTRKFVWDRKALITLFGCASTWFLLDITFYSQGLFQSDIYIAIGWVPSGSLTNGVATSTQVVWPQFAPDYLVGTYSSVCASAYPLDVLLPGVNLYKGYTTDSKHACVPAARIDNVGHCDAGAGNIYCWMSPLDYTFLNARAQAIISLTSVIPGYWATVFTIEHLGRWNIQMMGFFMMTAFLAFLAGFYDYFLANVNGFITMYAFTFFFANFGPNSTTFVYPAEVFPASVRSTAHGICAACGKAGAIVGATGFLYAKADPRLSSDYKTYGGLGLGLQKALGILAAINFLGMMCTFAVPDVPLNTSLEELNDEFDRGDTAMMERA